jgi:hypothetical protein
MVQISFDIMASRLSCVHMERQEGNRKSRKEVGSKEKLERGERREAHSALRTALCV